MNRWNFESPIYIKGDGGLVVGIMDLGDNYLVFELESGKDYEPVPTLVEAINFAHNLLLDPFNLTL